MSRIAIVLGCLVTACATPAGRAPSVLDSQQAVLVHLDMRDATMADVESLESKLRDAVEYAAAGEYDGNEIGATEAVLYLYGPSAQKLFDAIAPALRESRFKPRLSVELRAGPPGTPLTRAEL